MDNIPVPTLSEDGWVRKSEEKADYLFSHFFVAEYSQTFFYVNEVSSFPYIIQKNQGQPDSAAQDLKTTLLIYFGRYFKSVLVDVKQEEVPVNSGKIQITLHVNLTDENGKEINLARTAEVLNSKLTNVLNIVNG